MLDSLFQIFRHNQMQFSVQCKSVTIYLFIVILSCSDKIDFEICEQSRWN